MVCRGQATQVRAAVSVIHGDEKTQCYLICKRLLLRFTGIRVYNQVSVRQRRQVVYKRLLRTLWDSPEVFSGRTDREFTHIHTDRQFKLCGLGQLVKVQKKKNRIETEYLPIEYWKISLEYL